MKTHTSKRKVWIRSLLLFPLVALLLFSFSAKEEIDRLGSEPIDYTLQDGATKSQVNEYNKLAKKYNEMDESNMRIKRSDIDRLKYLYNLMSSKQRKNSQPFPNFPPPPPAVEKVPNNIRVVKGVNDKGANVPPPPPKEPKEPKAPKVKQEKVKIKEEKKKVKLKKEEEKLVIQRVKFEKRNQERQAERLVLVDKRKVERENMKTLQHKEMENQRVALRLETNNERLQKREVQIKERQIKQEEKKNAEYKRQVEQKRVPLKEENI